MSPRSGLAAVVAALILVSASRADSVSVGFDNGTVNKTDSILTFKTTGSGPKYSMGGMSVKFYFTDGSDSTTFWASGSNSIGDSKGVSLSLTGDSYFAQWKLTNANADGLGVTRMEIDAGLGDTVFDRTFRNAPGTPGSSAGKDFRPTTGKAGLDIVAMYSDVVKVGINPPVGDLFRMLAVDFMTTQLANKALKVANGGLTAGTTMKLWLDTDSVEPLTTPNNIKTPAPPALLLGLIGAVPLFLRRRPTVVA